MVNILLSWMCNLARSQSYVSEFSSKFFRVSSVLGVHDWKRGSSGNNLIKRKTAYMTKSDLFLPGCFKHEIQRSGVILILSNLMPKSVHCFKFSKRDLSWGRRWENLQNFYKYVRVSPSQYLPHVSWQSQRFIVHYFWSWKDKNINETEMKLMITYLWHQVIILSSIHCPEEIIKLIFHLFCLLPSLGKVFIMWEVIDNSQIHTTCTPVARWVG